jgi:hopanoid biosynthesis associated RND transporter like protein HpnN
VTGTFIAQTVGAVGTGASRWIDFVRRRVATVLILVVAATGASAYHTVSELKIDTDTTSMISPDVPFRRQAEAFMAAFPQFANSIVIVVEGDTPDRADDAAMSLADGLKRVPNLFHTIYAPQIDPFFARNGFLYLDTEELDALSDRLADAEPLLADLARDPSLRGLFKILGLALDDVAAGKQMPDGFANALERIVAVGAAAASGDSRPLSWSELMRGPSSGPNDRRRFIRIQPVLDFESLEPAAPVMAEIHRIARERNLVPERGVRVLLTGTAAMATEELRSVSVGASAAGLISLVFVGLVLVLGLRSLRLVAAVLLTLIIGLVWTAGFTTLAIGHLNLISVAFAVLFIGLGVDFGIHFGLRYKEAVDGGLDHGAALGAAATGVAWALTLCAVAAAGAFYAFWPTDYDGLSELGIIAGTGMFIALFASLTVLPALLTLAPLAPRRGHAAQSGAAEAWLHRNGRWLSSAAIVLGIGASFVASSARFDANPISLKDPSTESVKTFLELMRDSRTAPYTIEAIADDLAAATALAGRIGRLDTVDRVVTLASFVPEDQETKLETIDNMAVFLNPVFGAGGTDPPPDATQRRAATRDFRERLAAAAPHAPEGLRATFGKLGEALSGLSAVEGGLARLERDLMLFLPGRLQRLREALGADEVAIDGLPESIRARYLAADGRARVQVFPRHDINDSDAMRRFVDDVRGVAPEATDAPVEIVESGRVVVRAVLQAGATATIVIIVMLAAFLGSWRGTLLIAVPLVLSAVFTVAATVVLDAPFNFANVIVLPLLVGLGTAGGIHFVVRAMLEARTASLLRSSTPRAIILSALTTIGSFGSLAVSGHRGTASMGELLMIAISFSLLCTLVVLPALMTWLRPSSAEVGAGE